MQERREDSHPLKQLSFLAKRSLFSQRLRNPQSVVADVVWAYPLVSGHLAVGKYVVVAYPTGALHAAVAG